ncbi:MAG: hypothetical protein Q9190_006215 [Brigantiaea leucoxantha]
MLEWLRGSAEPSSLQAYLTEGQSSIEEPETPAPVFAVRAFKTALFGTPAPRRHNESSGKVEAPAQQHPRVQVLSHPRAEENKEEKRDGTPLEKKIDPPISPAKGILLTPGTSITRRKTVSFGSLAGGDGQKKLESTVAIAPSAHDFEKTPVIVAGSDAKDEKPQQQTNLTKAQFQAQLDASKIRLSRQTALELEQQDKRRFDVGIDIKTPPNETEVEQPSGEATIDLSRPCSKSGRHWKAEFEKYHKKSGREMKQIIKYGQTVKAYAERKDQEATALNEKLKHELQRCAAMEAKVSSLATKLAASRDQGTCSTADQHKLVSDLAKQTALAIRYKQKAERYRAAASKQRYQSKKAGDESRFAYDKEDTVNLITEVDEIANPLIQDREPEGEKEKRELTQYQDQISVAEEKAAKLESENSKLKDMLRRVKKEMKNYDNRRQRQESGFKRQTEKLQDEKRVCERKLQRLSEQHQDLLRSITEQLANGASPDRATRDDYTPTAEILNAQLIPQDLGASTYADPITRTAATTQTLSPPPPPPLLPSPSTPPNPTPAL